MPERGYKFPDDQFSPLSKFHPHHSFGQDIHDFRIFNQYFVRTNHSIIAPCTLVIECHDNLLTFERKKILRDMDELLYKEKILWKQRSRIDKIKWGDCNTIFFRAKASWRAKKIIFQV